MNYANMEIEKAIRLSMQPKWRIAETIGIADTTFSKWLRHPLSEEKHAAVISAITKLSKERDI